MKKISRKEALEQINEFFRNIKEKSSKEIKKIKRLAMKYNLPLKEKRKMFCKKCLSPYSGKEKIRVKNQSKLIVCENCKNISKWKIK